MSFFKTIHQKLLRNTLGLTQRNNLVRLVGSLLPQNDALVLDIGCGNGAFARDLMAIKPNLDIVGVETLKRGDSFIKQCSYDGNTLPFADKSFEFVMLINVLHHAEDPARVLREAIRVTRQAIIIKDHYANTWLDFYNLVVMEMVGNAFSGIAQPYYFLSEKKWTLIFGEVGLKAETLLTRFVSYNRFVDLFCGRNLHFIAKMAPLSVKIHG